MLRFRQLTYLSMYQCNEPIVIFPEVRPKIPNDHLIEWHTNEWAQSTSNNFARHSKPVDIVLQEQINWFLSFTTRSRATVISFYLFPKYGNELLMEHVKITHRLAGS